MTSGFRFPGLSPLQHGEIVAEVLADHGRTQLRTAETEKYPHVTYFFNGGHDHRTREGTPPGPVPESRDL